MGFCVRASGGKMQDVRKRLKYRRRLSALGQGIWLLAKRYVSQVIASIRA
jgi:hypothetical protein